MIALLILALFAGGLAIACAWADSQPPTDPEPYDQPTHVHVLDDQEHNA